MRSNNANEAITRRAATPILTAQSVGIPVLYPCADTKRDGAAYVFERATDGEYRTVEHSVEVVPMLELQRYFVQSRDAKKKAALAAQFKPLALKYGELENPWRSVWIDDNNLAGALENGLVGRARELINRHLGIGPPARAPIRALVDKNGNADSKLSSHSWRDDDFYSGGDVARAESRDPMAFLAGHINNGLQEIRFVVWRDDKTGKLRPGLYCFLSRQLAYAALITQLGRPGSTAFCKRCGAQYERKRKRNLYCSHNCRVADAMRRYRAKKKSKNKRGMARRSG